MTSTKALKDNNAHRFVLLLLLAPRARAMGCGVSKPERAEEHPDAIALAVEETRKFIAEGSRGPARALVITPGNGGKNPGQAQAYPLLVGSSIASSPLSRDPRN